MRANHLVSQSSLTAVSKDYRETFEWTLGRLMMNFGALEHRVLFGIVELAKNDSLEPKTAPLPEKFDRRVSLLDCLAKKRVEDAETEAHRTWLMTEIKKLGHARNHFAHGAWLDSPHVNIDDVKGKIRWRNLRVSQFKVW